MMEMYVMCENFIHNIWPKYAWEASKYRYISLKLEMNFKELTVDGGKLKAMHEETTYLNDNVVVLNRYAFRPAT